MNDHGRILNPHCSSLLLLIFYEGAQSIERRLPLLRYLIEVTFQVNEAVHSKLPDAFPARPEAARQPSLLQSMQMFCDCLTRDRRAGRKAHDRQGPFLAESSDEVQAGLVTQRREDESGIGQFRGGGESRSGSPYS
jgi:hypothetical protein